MSAALDPETDHDLTASPSRPRNDDCLRGLRVQERSRQWIKVRLSGMKGPLPFICMMIGNSLMTSQHIAAAMETDIVGTSAKDGVDGFACTELFCHLRQHHAFRMKDTNEFRFHKDASPSRADLSEH